MYVSLKSLIQHGHELVHLNLIEIMNHTQVDFDLKVFSKLGKVETIIHAIFGRLNLVLSENNASSDFFCGLKELIFFPITVMHNL